MLQNRPLLPIFFEMWHIGRTHAPLIPLGTVFEDDYATVLDAALPGITTRLGIAGTRAANGISTIK